jgi:hypothetical protein
MTQFLDLPRRGFDVVGTVDDGLRHVGRHLAGG